MNRKQRRAKAKDKTKGAEQNTDISEALQRSKNNLPFLEKLQTAKKYIHSGQTAPGTKILSELIKQDPNHPEALELFGQACTQLENFSAALNFYIKAKELQPQKHILDTILGNIYLRLDNIELGEKHLKQAAINIDKNKHTKEKAVAYFQLSNFYLFNGDKQQAESYLDKAIDLAPTYIDPLYNKVSYITAIDAPSDSDYMALRAIEDNHLSSLSSYDKIMLFYALYKANEQMKDFDTAFHYVSLANQHKKDTVTHDDFQTHSIFKTIEKYFDSTFISSIAQEHICPNLSEQPVFIYGMPRSGTTLLEQILGAHPDIKTVGEDAHLINAIQKYSFLPAHNDTAYPLRTQAKEAGVVELKDLAQSYIEHINQKTASKASVNLQEDQNTQRNHEDIPLVNQSSKRILNKAILNYFYFPLFLCLYPNAKHIHITRDALDCCLSCYTHHFTAGGYYYTYDLEDLGHYYQYYSQLLEHWKTTYPNKIHTVSYEDITQDIEGKTQEILEYLELEWDEACLSFYQSKERVYTASTMQVRKPIYTSAVQRWKRYEKHLEPLIKALGKHANI